MKTNTKAKRGSPVRVNPIVRPLPAGSLLRHMRPPTKDFPFWYYTGPWPNSVNHMTSASGAPQTKEQTNAND